MTVQDPGPARGMPPTRSALGWIVEGCTRAAEALMLAMMALITIEVVSRGFFAYSLLLVDEVAGYMLVAILFLGVTYSFRSGSLLRVDFFLHWLSPRSRHWLEGGYLLVAFAFMAIMDYATIRFVLSTFNRDIHAPTLLGTPLYLPQAVMPAGMTLLAVALLAAAIDSLRRAWAGHEDDTGRASGEPGGHGGAV